MDNQQLALRLTDEEDWEIVCRVAHVFAFPSCRRACACGSEDDVAEAFPDVVSTAV
jgi:hypothetical protein